MRILQLQATTAIDSRLAQSLPSRGFAEPAGRGGIVAGPDREHTHRSSR